MVLSSHPHSEKRPTMTPSCDTVRIVVFDNPDYAPSRHMLAAAHDVVSLRSDVDVEQVDVWQDPDKGVEHGVMTVPTTIIFLNGEEQERLCGPRSARFLIRTIDRIMAEQPVRRPTPQTVLAT